MSENQDNKDYKLHLVIGEDIPSDAPAEFNSIAMYIREKDDSLKLYAELALPYLINHSRFVTYFDDDHRYYFDEGYEPETGCCQYSCMLKPFGKYKGLYRLGLNYLIKIRSIEPLCDEPKSDAKKRTLINK